MQICVISRNRVVEPLLQVVGHEGSEITGPAFSPDGTRLYFSSQRGANSTPIGPVSGGFGITFEVTGPFHGAANTTRAHRRLVSNKLHNDVEPPLRGLSGALADLLHTAEKLFGYRGL
jgi:hypothetical protein